MAMNMQLDNPQLHADIYKQMSLRSEIVQAATSYILTGEADRTELRRVLGDLLSEFAVESITRQTNSLRQRELIDVRVTWTTPSGDR